MTCKIKEVGRVSLQLNLLNYSDKNYAPCTPLHHLVLSIGSRDQTVSGAAGAGASHPLSVL